MTIVEGPPEEDLIIRISDSGGGLPDLIEQLAAPARSAAAAYAKAAAPPAASFATSTSPSSIPEGMQNDGDVSSGSAGAEAGSHGSHTEKQYPIHFGYGSYWRLPSQRFSCSTYAPGR